MTENKRFYYNIFYHRDDPSRVLEYEIIDRQSYPDYPNHDEKEDIPDWEIYISENDSGWQDMLVNLLNQLDDENEKVKSEYKVLHSQYQDLKNFVENNFNEYLTREKLDKQIVELSNENEQLKKENEGLKFDIRYFETTYEIEESGLDIVPEMCTITSSTPSRKELFKENEQLKLKNKELQSELDIRKEDINHSNKVFMKLCDKNNELREENLQLKDIVKDIMIELNANHTMNTYQITIPINKVIYNELNRRLEETPFNEELRRFLE